MKTYVAAFAAFFMTFLTMGSSLDAEDIRFEIQNTAVSGGFFFTPVFLGFHDGSFDVFDSGGMASAELEALAEGGDTMPLSDLLVAGQASAVAHTVFGDSFGPPPFDPGEATVSIFNLDSSNHRFMNFASMVIPSNDAFFGNADALELFDAGGDFVGDMSFEITASMIYDAGTEVNDINGGAAFSANGGMSVSESNAIGLIDLDDLNDFIGSQTVSGATITSGFSPDTVVARFTISSVPEPGAFSLICLVGGAGLFTRRRRR